MKKTRNTQKGFTLIEISFVLVIAVLLILGILKANAYINDTKAKNEADNVLFIQQHLKDKYRSQASTAGLTTTTAITGNAIPKTMTTTATTITNQFNAAATVAPTTLSVANDGVMVTENGLPNAVCQRMITLLYPYVNMIDNGTTVAYKQYNGVAPVAYDPAAADALCNSANDSNLLNIYFYKN